MQRHDVAQRPRQIMEAAYLALGLATMALPDVMLDISVQDPSQGNDLTRLVFQCFGFQATLCALVILTSRFRAVTYLAFAAAVIPVFVFDYWFWTVEPVLTGFGAAIDAVFNVIFVTMCWIGFQQERRADELAET